VLRRNRRILSDLYDEGRLRVHKDALFALGFNFSFFTHTTETSSGSKFRYCYEFGIRIIEDNFAEIRVNSEFLDLNG
jgi:hypothetical protein